MQKSEDNTLKLLEEFKNKYEIAVNQGDILVPFKGELFTLEDCQNAIAALESLLANTRLYDLLLLVLNQIALTDCIIKPVMFNGHLVECLCLKNTTDNTESPILLGVTKNIFDLITPL